MSLDHLTKKNQDFIYTARKQLAQIGKSETEINDLINEILPTIEENQNKGITAKALFGSPSAWAQSKSDAAAENQSNEVKENDHPFAMWGDSALFILGFVSLIMGFMNSVSKTQLTYGWITLLAMAAIGGLVLYSMYYYIYRLYEIGQKPSLLKSFLVISAATLLWIGALGAASLLPTSINPQLSPIALLIIGAAALGIRYLLKQCYHIKSASASRRPQ